MVPCLPGLAGRGRLQPPASIASVGVDTWGVDFGLLGGGDELLGNPYHYRDHRTDGMLEKAFGVVSREEIFRHTGLQFMQLNTLYQLLAMKLSDSPLLGIAKTFLMMPDLFHWLLTGVMCNEMSEASTSQFYDPVRGGLGHRAAGAFRPADRNPRPHRAAGNKPRPPARASRPQRACRPTWSCPAHTTRPAP